MSVNSLLSSEFPLVAALALAGTLDSRFYAAAVLVELLFWPLRRWKLGRWSQPTPFDLPIVLLLLTLAVTLWASSLPDKTLPQVLRLLAGAALFYALVNWAVFPRRLRLVVGAALVLGVVLAGSAPFIVRWNALKLELIPAQIYAGFRLLVVDSVNPNVIAGALVLLVSLGAGLLLFAWGDQTSWRAGERWLALLCVGLGTLVVGLTQSRGAWLALAVGLLLLVALRWRWGWLAPAAAAAAGALLALWLGPPRLTGSLVSSVSLGGWDGRLEVWSRAVYMIQDFPFSGIGMGTFSDVADRLYPFFLYTPGTVEHAHNLFLQVAVDLGLPGLIAWLAIYLLGLFTAWRVWRLGKGQGNRWFAGLGAGLLAAQAALGVHGLLDAVLWGMVRTAPLVWLIWGLSAAALNFGELTPELSGEHAPAA